MIDTYKMYLNYLSQVGYPKVKYCDLKGKILDENEFLFDSDIIQQMYTKLEQRFRQWIGE